MAVLIWLAAGTAVASSVVEGDMEWLLRARGYFPCPFYFGDYDYLCDADGRRLGVSFIPLADEVLRSPLLSESRNVERDGAMVSFLFAPTRCWRIDTAQEMGTVVYKSQSGDIILLLPDCDLDPNVLGRWF